ncbi:hypothetical protein T12_9301 [Trichinella patagoniensis]|uniref:Uncharacterized protein n=1 Tax=Trichinella patagoniensis TaxID=990121 RepID=A0A0V0Z3L9_9BILA|nr:hypothetical protein T12_9301 [Trichinella patagoniensis]
MCQPCTCSRQRLHHVHCAAFDRTTVPSTGTFEVHTCLNHFSSTSSSSAKFPLRIRLRASLNSSASHFPQTPPLISDWLYADGFTRLVIC